MFHTFDQLIGLHLRVTSTLYGCLEYAHALRLPFFQCFFIHQTTGKYVSISDKEYSLFAQASQQMQPLFAHASYWINLAADSSHSGIYLLRTELEKAKKLGFRFLVLHPGCGATSDMMLSIGNIARKLNRLLRKEDDVIILLENTAFGPNTVGGALSDLAQIRDRLDHPEKVQFCIDTAHAYMYGYNIRDFQERESFIHQLEMFLGIDAIKLIHLNDAYEAFGSRKDQHAQFGMGTLGEEALVAFIHHPALQGIPLILEPPLLSDQELLQMLNYVRTIVQGKQI